MNKSLSQVLEFHNTFNHPVLDTPTIPSKDRCQLRVDLIQEELNELSEAIENNDLVEIADALSDLQYVLNGAVLEFGMKDKSDELNDEVHRSNMSKACNDLAELYVTQNYYKEKGIETFYEESEGKYIVKRKSDSKILKNKYYSNAKISQILFKV